MIATQLLISTFLVVEEEEYHDLFPLPSCWPRRSLWPLATLSSPSASSGLSASASPAPPPPPPSLRTAHPPPQPPQPLTQLSMCHQRRLEISICTAWPTCSNPSAARRSRAPSNVRCQGPRPTGSMRLSSRRLRLCGYHHSQNFYPDVSLFIQLSTHCECDVISSPLPIISRS